MPTSLIVRRPFPAKLVARPSAGHIEDKTIECSGQDDHHDGDGWGFGRAHLAALVHHDDLWATGNGTLRENSSGELVVTYHEECIEEEEGRHDGNATSVHGIVIIVRYQTGSGH